MNKTPTRHDGSCSECCGRLCKFHQEQGLKNDQRRADAIKRASKHHRELDIARTCSRYELESDELFTARQKALMILRNQ
jgi:hypothetical protein